MFSLILIVPGMICLYAMILRPLLRKIPAFKDFYEKANGFWAKVWALCGKSMTIAWAYILGGISAAFELVDQLGAVLGDPNMNLKQQVADTLKDHPELLGYVGIAISIITLIARVRKGMQ